MSEKIAVRCKNKKDGEDEVRDGKKKTIDDVDPDALCDFCEGHYENMSRNRCKGCRCSEAFEMYLEENNLNEMEETMNTVIKEVFKEDEYQLVERMDNEFGGEIANTFQARIDLNRDKKLYVAELEKREDAREKAKAAITTDK